jgi:hypothetical protein
LSPAPRTTSNKARAFQSSCALRFSATVGSLNSIGPAPSTIGCGDDVDSLATSAAKWSTPPSMSFTQPHGSIAPAAVDTRYSLTEGATSGAEVGGSVREQRHPTPSANAPKMRAENVAVVERLDTLPANSIGVPAAPPARDHTTGPPVGNQRD